MANVDSLEIEIVADYRKADKSLNSLADTISKVQKNMKGLQGLTNTNSKNFQNFSTNVKNLGKNMRSLQSSMNTSGKNFNNFSNNVKNLKKNISGGSNSVKGFAFSAGKLYIAVNVLRKAFDGLGASIKESMNYIETYNYFTEAFGQVASKAGLGAWKELGYESADAYYNSFSERARELTQKMSGFTIADDGSLSMGSGKSLGIDPAQVMQYQAVFGQMSSSIGIASETSLKLSNALTQIGADLASVKNMDFNKVWTDMQSGLAGMSRTMDKYGVNIRNVNLQQKLNELGIKANIQNLNQNDKALLRSIIILDSTRYAWGDLSETINAPANQFRLLQANVTNLARAIGNLLLPVISKIIPYVNAAVMGLTKMVEYIGKVFGIKTGDWSGSLSGASDAMSDLLDQTDDEAGAIDNATKAVKKLRHQLQGFDELNVINSDQEDASGSVSDGVTNASGALSSALDKILEEYQKAWDAAYNNMNLKSTNILEALKEKAKEIGNSFSLGFDTANVSTKGTELVEKWRGIVDQIKGILNDKGVSDAIAKMGTSAVEAAGAIAGSINSLLTSAGYGIAGGTEDALKDSDEYIKEKTTSISENITSLNEKIKDFATAIATIGTAFESESFQQIVSFFEKLSIYATMEVWDTFTGVISDLFGILTKPISENATKWKDLLQNVLDIVAELVGPFDSLVDTLMANSESYEDSFLHKALTGISDFVTTKIGDKLDSLNKTLETFKNVITIIKGVWAELTSGKKDMTANLSVGGSDKVSILEKISDAWSKLKQGTKNLISKLTMKGSKSSALETLRKTWSKLKEGTKSLIAKATATGSSVLQTLSNAWGKIKESTKKLGVNISIPFKDALVTVSNLWDNLKNNLSLKLSATFTDNFSTALKRAWNSVAMGINSAIDKINSWAGTKIGKIYVFPGVAYGKANGGLYSAGKWKPITQYAGGGLPNQGQMFIAREAGPELVGTIGGHTAVVNNDQIVASVSAGVYKAVKEAMAETNNNVTFQVEGDPNGIFRVTQKQANDYMRRTGRPAFAT